VRPHPDDYVDDIERVCCGKCEWPVEMHVEEDGDRLHPRYPEEACYWDRELAGTP